ncbi:uncharacterized protein LACBIDRAFT_328514 [Laccaria bicolor S238N-H82]|uniref:Predicted protein n=1 Tax=Laccaria bicolor (strain S238N-H82 / ATCC MYA-4686) TaxID=486041 RepID=B0DF35_LACBS|nr:uncharacterized protein LACBIDRAFT_328514 [Laccaria bicolor S238N-H82]EDR06781.1 predicted protein [Laccaria bicolor S238N-H82]|eukprot:XP_001882628.1 predicted protein [Laccaria bicolor S238N-H82]
MSKQSQGKVTNINHDFLRHNHHHSPSQDTSSVLHPREDPSSGPSPRFWEDKALSSHLLDIMGYAMAAISSSNLQDAIGCTYFRCVDDFDGPMNNDPSSTQSHIIKDCVYRKPLAGVHFSSMVLYRNSNADHHPASLTTLCTDVADDRGQGVIVGYLEDVAVADVPSGQQKSSWLDNTVRRGYDLEYRGLFGDWASPSSIPLVSTPRIWGQAVLVQLIWFVRSRATIPQTCSALLMNRRPARLRVTPRIDDAWVGGGTCCGRPWSATEISSLEFLWVGIMGQRKGI